MKYQNDVIRSVLFLHIRPNHGMMVARDFASCHAARSTLVMIVANNVQKLRWPAKTLDLNPIDHLLYLLKRKVCAQPLQLNLRLVIVLKVPAFWVILSLLDFKYFLLHMSMFTSVFPRSQYRVRKSCTSVITLKCFICQCVPRFLKLSM